MVKLGLIGEGDTEKRIMESEPFRKLLKENKIDFIKDVVNGKGNGNLIPKKLSSFEKILNDKGATHILILADKESAPCITEAKNNIDPDGNNMVIIANRQIENWFLADSKCMSSFFQNQYVCDNPEEVENPFELIKEKRIELKGRGIGNKRTLGRRMLQSGFSVQNAAAHPNCPSAKYFLGKLKSLSSSS